jgi:DNA-binding NarL/FixJ family response regulator
MIRVLLVTEMELVGNVIAAILEAEPDMVVSGSVTSVKQAAKLLGGSDVVLVSPRLPRNGALELTTLVRESYPSVKVVVFGLTESKAQVLKYIEAGADGYVVKDSAVEDLLERIRAAHDDRAVVSPEIAAALMSRVARFAQLFAEVEAGINVDVGLTPRELEILELIGLGLTNRQIAQHLTIEVGTVKNHVHSILHKLDVRSREDAAAYLTLLKEGGESQVTHM